MSTQPIKVAVIASAVTGLGTFGIMNAYFCLSDQCWSKPRSSSIAASQAAEFVDNDAFAQAVDAATQAANLTQTARTPEEWTIVVGYWQSAIAHMNAVPLTHERISTALQRVDEYSRNLDYAQQKAAPMGPEP